MSSDIGHLTFLLSAGCLAAAPVAANRPPAAHLTVDATVGDLLAHRAFAGFGHLLLPWDDRRSDTSMRLRDIGSLLPYHSHVDPAVVVCGVRA